MHVDVGVQREKEDERVFYAFPGVLEPGWDWDGKPSPNLGDRRITLLCTKRLMLDTTYLDHNRVCARRLLYHCTYSVLNPSSVAQLEKCVL